MPGYKTHLAGGLILAAGGLGILFWAGVYWPGFEKAAVLLAIAALAALFPDVDTDSKGQHLFYGALFIGDLGLIAFGRYVWAALLGLFAMLPAVGQHRGWTHTWWAALVVPLPLLLLPPYLFDSRFLGPDWHRFLPYYLAAVAGYVSHLLMDGTLKS
ncbi:Protein of unknown function DUF457, transmembrane [Desulfovibrio sp. X2]|uniref:metal-dependent hydrolase n=1 Tax=Desulfovibrio sp. X2 TaxID=941449 RepID=UPI0003588610|nr:metal-dependent hydrolase [Desulfovibrio sp. X2]EPR37464.1 Protein of unknown function DUF457, transmembrane [Desulfovibrio sp. X2]